MIVIMNAIMGLGMCQTTKCKKKQWGLADIKGEESTLLSSIWVIGNIAETVCTTIGSALILEKKMKALPVGWMVKRNHKNKS